jgi:hypothetical protein
LQATTITSRTPRSRFTKNLLKNSKTKIGCFDLVNQIVRFPRERNYE